MTHATEATYETTEPTAYPATEPERQKGSIED
jgi:hypothetical protein